MQPASDLHVEWVQDEAVVLNRGSGELHYLNTSAALVLAAISEYGFDEGLAYVKSTQTDSLEDELPSLVEMMLEKGILIDE